MAEEPATVRSLNDFPDHLLLHILSFLPTLDAIRTASLSKKWLRLWPSLSSLNFDYAFFPPAPSATDTRRLFAEFVDKTLLLRPHRPPPILKLRFEFDLREDRYFSHIDSWIRHAVRDGAVEIDFDFYISREFQVGREFQDNETDCLFDFHIDAIRNGRVRVLKLCRCDLILPIDISTVRFESIQSLYLDQIFMTDDNVSDLISACSNLENLVMDYCYGVKNMKICSAKLKVLSLWNYHSQSEEDEESVEICAPNLRSISIIRVEMGKYSCNETQNLVAAYVEFMHEEKHYKYWSKVVRLFSGVKRLVVENWWFRLHASKDVSPGNLMFNNLNSLELRTGYTKYDLLGIAALLECSPNLHRLTVDNLFKIDEDESISEELLNKPINFSLSCLRQVKIKNFSGTENEFNFVRILKEQGVALEKIIVVGRMMDTLVIPMRQKHAAQGSSSHSEVGIN